VFNGLDHIDEAIGDVTATSAVLDEILANMSDGAGRGKNLEAIFPMPADMLSPVVAALLADRFHYLSLDGGPMSRREAGIRHYSFRRTLADDDLPAERKA